jgi:pimeloyl-ACP methyl ester carboxylesterase
MILYLLPGLLCDASVWRHQQAHLSAFAEVRIPDFRGFDSLAAMARSVLEDAPETFSLAGHSMGGRVALEVMNLAGARVQKLALLDTGVHPRTSGEAQKRQSLIDLARREGIPALAQAWARPMVHPARQEGPLMDEICAMVSRYTLDEYEGQVQALLNRPDARAYLPDIACETLVLVGRQDTWSPVAQHEEFAARIPHASLRVIDNCGHMSPMEQPALVTAELRRWLSS